MPSHFLYSNLSDQWQKHAKSYRKLKGIVNNLSLDTMLRGLLHPSEYKEILFQISEQPIVTYGSELSTSAIARAKMRARDNELREKIRRAKTLADAGKGVMRMAASIKALSTVTGSSNQKNKEQPETAAEVLRKAKTLAFIVSAFKDNLKAKKVKYIENTQELTIPDRKKTSSEEITIAR